MFFGTIKHGHLTLKLVFGILTLTFLFLSIRDYSEILIIGKICGYLGLACGAVALYTSCAEVIEGEQVYSMMPI